jgi:GNAT superfamily N-acetyltransferase
MNIYKIHDTDNKLLILYFSKNEIEYKKFKNNKNNIPYIYYIYDNDIANLIYLYTNKNNRNKGYATKLLKKSIKILKNMNIKKIELDDMSDNNWSEHNIYIKNGFSYINNFPEPEMIMFL